ncbi:MAG: hypothetical protein L6V83_02420 [Christensenella sp.]|nr:MAG: hypothetical protein L6V83_02420 [Christensenella sp.]
MQYYQNNAPLCDEIVTDCVEDTESLESAINALCHHTVRVVEPKQGVRKQLLELAHSNAYDAMTKHGTQEERKNFANARRSETTWRNSQFAHFA